MAELDRQSGDSLAEYEDLLASVKGLEVGQPDNEIPVSEQQVVALKRALQILSQMPRQYQDEAVRTTEIFISFLA